MRLEIADAPTADVVEVVHGEWMENDLSVWADCPTDGYPVAVCSVCGMRFCDIINNIGWMYNHCPHCGAKMDGNVLPYKFLGKSQDGECGVEILDRKDDSE